MGREIEPSLGLSLAPPVYSRDCIRTVVLIAAGELRLLGPLSFVIRRESTQDNLSCNFHPVYFSVDIYSTQTDGNGISHSHISK